MRLSSTRARVAIVAGLVAVIMPAAVLGASLIGKDAKSEHWGVVPRNTIGSPVAQLRDGPYGSIGHTGKAAEPPFGKGSLGIEVSGDTEKVDFGNEVDFFGDPLLALNAVGFYVFQTGENVGYGGPANLPNIRLEIDPNTPTDTNNYSTMVWVPGAVPLTLDEWSGYIDATTTGTWYFTGSADVPPCNSATPCTFAAAMAALAASGAPDPVIYSIAVGKGRDSQWIGAIDGLRINDRIYDFEADGVKKKDAK